ncbi:MAG: flagellar protein G [Candidatus Thermoplasmatota archaeon]|nr:flagellar protein G [Candidatus Thermoplasmatota archaeon]
MGFSLTGTHVIFFIASVIVAVTVSGIFMAATNNISTSLSDRGGRIQEQLDTEFTIINDPQNIPNISGYYRFYLKNVGRNTLQTTNQTFQLFIDGDIIAITNYNFSDETISPGEVTIIYIANTEASAGDHTLRVVGPQAIDDEFVFSLT